MIWIFLRENHLYFSALQMHVLLYVFLISFGNDWWWAKNTSTQQSGYIPANYVVIDDDSIESQV